MITLDLRTIVLLSPLMCGLMAAMLYAAHRSFPLGVRGLGYWAGGELAVMLTAVLFGLRGVLPDWLSIIAGNGAMIVALSCWLLGLQRFYGLTMNLRPCVALLVIGLLLSLYFLYAVPSLHARIVLLSGMASIFFCYMAYLIGRYGERHFSTWIFLSLMVFQSLVVLLRFGSAVLQGQVGATLFSPDLIQTVYVGTFNFMSQALALCFMMVANRALHRVLQQISNIDPLTQTLNRRALLDVYQAEVSRATRQGQALTMLVLDLDYFKQINDRHGHAVGDKVLSHAAGVMRHCLRDEDHIARIGGEEFLALLPDTDLAAAELVAQRILAALRATPPDGLPVCTASIGLAAVNLLDTPFERVFCLADAALYRAKEAGRDRYDVAPATPLGQ